MTQEPFGRFLGWRFSTPRPKFSKMVTGTNVLEKHERHRVLVAGCDWYAKPERVREKLDKYLKDLLDPVLVFANEFRGFGAIVNSYATWNWLLYDAVALNLWKHGKKIDKAKKLQRIRLLESVMDASKKRRLAIFFWDKEDEEVEKLIDMCIEEKIKYRVIPVSKRKRR